jgi:hypothetical protein
VGSRSLILCLVRSYRVVSGERKEFIVLAIGDRDKGGFAETAYLRLLQLIDSSAPDTRVCSPLGVVAYYLRSPRATASVENVISRAETLRDGDEAFSTIGIGLAHGPLIADFDADDRVNPSLAPLGVVTNHASRGVYEAQTYRDILNELREPQKT